MGISGLLTILEPYARPDYLDSRRVVIDGPALAYHILHKCERNGYPIPSYELLALSAIAWLDELVKHGVVVYVFILPLLVHGCAIL